MRSEKTTTNGMQHLNMFLAAHVHPSQAAEYD